MSQLSPPVHKPDVTDRDIVDYLRKHPHFLAERPALLAEIDLPHVGGSGAISLVERQVAILRERNMDMRHRLNHLLDNARTNDVLFDKSKRLILSLLSLSDSNDLLPTFFTYLHNEFAIQYSQLLLFPSNECHFTLPSNRYTQLLNKSLATEKLPTLLNNKRAICGQLKNDETTFIFRRDADFIRSTATATLTLNHQTIGLLVLGNTDPNYYSSTMNTLFLTFITDVLSQLLAQYIRNKR